MDMSKKMSRAKRRQRALLWSAMVFLVLLLVALLVFVLTFSSIRAMYHPKVTTKLTLEAGSSLPAAETLLTGNQDAEIYYVTDPATVDTDVPGIYKVQVCAKPNLKMEFLSETVTKTVTITVVDTVAPTGEVRNLTVLPTGLPTPEDFLVSVSDKTDVTVSFVNAPKPDEDHQVIELRLTDAGGNETILSANLTVLIDREAPVISGVENLVAYTGDALAYRSGITVSDNMDGRPVLTVDSSKVDLSTPGTYTVTYIATDASGNTTTQEATVTVYQKQDYYVELSVIYGMVDEIMKDIIVPGMTTKQQVEAIYGWVRSNCSYIGTSDKSNWIQAAYVMMTNRQGDCYNYYGLVKLMLERLEIPNIDVEKVPNFDGDSMHYWSLVSVDGGKTWYHVDTTPRKVPTYFCLVTDKVMDDFSAGYRNCFNRDKSLYPATPEEPCE